ncbi:GGDEF domain-containing protein [Patescibacteria group bacterium]|nr:GGDEF domain-containing protein [Patescibacteria group bacterium]
MILRLKAIALVLRASRALLEVIVSYGEDIFALIREDHLTGLGNQRFFRETGEREVSRAARHGRPLSVVVIDLDGLKYVNDISGHAAGDRILQKVAEILKGNIRRLDWAFRPGGDEFSLILSETLMSGAKLLLERIIEDLANDGINASYGIACSDEVPLGERISSDEARKIFSELVDTADERMYRQKGEKGLSLRD